MGIAGNNSLDKSHTAPAAGGEITAKTKKLEKKTKEQLI